MSDDNRCAMPTVEERIERLRGDVNALYRLIPDNLEREQEERRQARWHATRDAALPGLMALAQFADEEWADVAAKVADRAHGPLEADARIEAAVLGAAAAADKVAELVKAALRIRAEYAESLPVSVGAAAEMELALRPFKPFEVQS